MHAHDIQIQGILNIGIITNFINDSLITSENKPKTCYKSRGGGYHGLKTQFISCVGRNGNLLKTFSTNDIINIVWDHQIDKSLFSISKDGKTEQYDIEDGIVRCTHFKYRLGIALYNESDVITLQSYGSDITLNQ